MNNHKTTHNGTWLCQKIQQKHNLKFEIQYLQLKQINNNTINSESNNDENDRNNEI